MKASNTCQPAITSFFLFYVKCELYLPFVFDSWQSLQLESSKELTINFDPYVFARSHGVDNVFNILDQTVSTIFHLTLLISSLQTWRWSKMGRQSRMASMRDSVGPGIDLIFSFTFICLKKTYMFKCSKNYDLSPQASYLVGRASKECQNLARGYASPIWQVFKPSRAVQ